MNTKTRKFFLAHGEKHKLEKIQQALWENATSIVERGKTLSKEFKEILKDVSLRLILKDKRGKQHCLPISWF